MSASSSDRPISVVLCDDVSEMRKLLRYALETDPRMRVVGEAGDGREGARVIAELQPDVVLLDLSMPEMDGLETIPEISSSAPETAIVVFSGFAAERMRDPALSSGADRYIEKGAPLDEIISTVREVADERRGEDGPGAGGHKAPRPSPGPLSAWLAWVGAALGSTSHAHPAFAG